MGVTELLTILFVALKLTGVVTWSWFIVFLPEIIGLGLYVILLLVYIVAAIKLTFFD